MDLPPAFGGLRALRHLDMSFNALQDVDEAGLEGMSSLQFLELGHNRLVGRAPRAV